LHEPFGLGRPILPASPSRPRGLSTTGVPTSWGTVGRVTWKSVLELTHTVNRTASAVGRELHRDARRLALSWHSCQPLQPGSPRPDHQGGVANEDSLQGSSVYSNA